MSRETIIFAPANGRETNPLRMQDLKISVMKRNRISRKDEIKARSFDKDNNLIEMLHDSGFTSVHCVGKELAMRGSGWLKPIHRMFLKNETKDWGAWYKKKGQKFVKESI